MHRIIHTPYIVGPPVLDKNHFFGRESELREIFGQLANLSSVSIVGEDRTGKTSLLHQIKNTYDDWLPTPHEFRVIYLDLQNAISPERFSRLFCLEIDDKRFRTKEDFTLNDLADAVSDSKLKILLCIDEFENSIHNDFGDEFFHQLRSLASSGKMALVVATKTPLNELYQPKEDITSSFYNIFWQIKLGEFTEEEAKGFIAEYHDGQPEFSTDEIEVISKLAGNHPLKLNLACSLAVTILKSEVPFDEFKAKLNADFPAKLANFFPSQNGNSGRVESAAPPPPQPSSFSAESFSAPSPPAPTSGYPPVKPIVQPSSTGEKLASGVLVAIIGLIFLCVAVQISNQVLMAAALLMLVCGMGLAIMDIVRIVKTEKAK